MLGTGTEGGGATQMRWGEETPEHAGTFDVKTLRDARSVDPEHSGLLGTGVQAPEVELVEEGAGLFELGPSEGASAWKRRLAPRHRRAVRSFFDNGEKDKR